MIVPTDGVTLTDEQVVTIRKSVMAYNRMRHATRTDLFEAGVRAGFAARAAMGDGNG